MGKKKDEGVTINYGDSGGWIRVRYVPLGKVFFLIAPGGDEENATRFYMSEDDAEEFAGAVFDVLGIDEDDEDESEDEEED